MNPRVKERCDRIAFWIDAGQVRTFAEIAIDTGEGKILQSITTAMFLWPYVFDVQNGER
jgi:hypothetical protein